MVIKPTSKFPGRLDGAGALLLKPRAHGCKSSSELLFERLLLQLLSEIFRGFLIGAWKTENQKNKTTSFLWLGASSQTDR